MPIYNNFTAESKKWMKEERNAYKAKQKSNPIDTRNVKETKQTIDDMVSVISESIISRSCPKRDAESC